MKKAFTLIELIVVIAIIAILAAIIAPNAFKAIEKANRSATLGDFRTIKTASMALYADTGTWPSTGCDETFLVDNTCAVNGAPSAPVVAIPGWDGPYLEQWPSRTRWGGIYDYTNDSNVNWDSVHAGVVGGDQARYLTMDNTPLDVLQRLDAQIDGDPAAAGCAASGENCGQHRWNVNDQYMLISTDVAVLN